LFTTPVLAEEENSELTKLELSCTHTKFHDLRSAQVKKGTLSPISLTIYPDLQIVQAYNSNFHYKESGNKIHWAGEAGGQSQARWESTLDRVTGVHKWTIWTTPTIDPKGSTEKDLLEALKEGIKPNQKVTPALTQEYLCEKTERMF